jgi:hypothetical protein
MCETDIDLPPLQCRAIVATVERLVEGDEENVLCFFIQAHILKLVRMA